MAVVALDPRGSIDTQMLNLCAPLYINESPSAEEWSNAAVPYTY